MGFLGQQTIRWRIFVGILEARMDGTDGGTIDGEIRNDTQPAQREGRVLVVDYQGFNASPDWGAVPDGRERTSIGVAMKVYVVTDFEEATRRPITMSIWSTARKALKALTHYRKVGFVSNRAEVSGVTVDRDAFSAN